MFLVWSLLPNWGRKWNSWHMYISMHSKATLQGTDIGRWLGTHDYPTTPMSFGEIIVRERLFRGNVVWGNAVWGNFGEMPKKQLFSLWETAMQLRSQRPLHVQGDARHPGLQGGGPKKNNWKNGGPRRRGTRGGWPPTLPPKNTPKYLKIKRWITTFMYISGRKNSSLDCLSGAYSNGLGNHSVGPAAVHKRRRDERKLAFSGCSDCFRICANRGPYSETCSNLRLGKSSVTSCERLPNYF
jgi:hypothetical protein